MYLQIGQETIYLLLTGGLFASLMLTLYVASLRGPTEQPPIVTLSEADGYTFPTGSAEIGPAFARALRTAAAPRLRELSDRYEAPIIEVIGHTDEMPLSGRMRGDLDAALIPWLSGARTREPVSSDNVGLGMARAVAVARALREAGLDDRYTIIPLSAGPLVKPGDVVTDGASAADERRRRRIELRLRRPAAEAR
ncbi:OmpA family protein [Sphingomonas lenta]|uniref:OmpA-like domain-containing protein n=1 Tax=Sphingomonas lenta TaxID=1141887 RepID=A0A2A2SCF2_9SPHN|nr:OmpA family protein [Sphingomonas lenta]PAX06875.1 hypothetical protein CKY28_12415 [Sphingomonas lenta]